MKNNIISLKDFRDKKETQKLIDLDPEELEDPVVIGWITDKNGERSLNVVSAVDTKECLWMIDLAQKIVDQDRVECRNENE
mgnify:FL=1